MFSTITSDEICQALEQVVAHYDTSDLEIGITSYSYDA